MKATEILALINAGYTKAEIDAMELPETAAAPDPIPEPVPEAEPETEPAKETPQPVQEKPNPVYPEIQALTKQINDLVSAIQKSNLLKTNQPQIQAESAEDILANIIAPTHKRAGN